MGSVSLDLYEVRSVWGGEYMHYLGPVGGLYKHTRPHHMCDPSPQNESEVANLRI